MATNAYWSPKGSKVIRFKVGDELFEMKLAKIPVGTFMMGFSKREITLVKEKFADKLQEYKTKYGYDFEAMEPEHEVELSTFSMGIYHVTRGQFGLFVKDDGYQTEAEQGKGGYGWNEQSGKFEGPDKKYSWKNTGFSQTDEHPVVNVTWNDAKMFLPWSSKRSGKRIVLPSEAQWGIRRPRRNKISVFLWERQRSNWLTTATSRMERGRKNFRNGAQRRSMPRTGTHSQLRWEASKRTTSDCTTCTETPFNGVKTITANTKMSLLRRIRFNWKTLR